MIRTALALLGLVWLWQNGTWIIGFIRNPSPLPLIPAAVQSPAPSPSPSPSPNVVEVRPQSPTADYQWQPKP